MKYLIIFILLFNTAQAQDNPPMEYDTIPELIPVVDFTSWYYIYDKTGKLVKKVTSYQSYSIPVGGWRSEQEFVNPDKYWVKGYTVGTYDTNNVRMTVTYLGMNKKPIPEPYRVCGVSIPRTGLNLKL